MSKMDGTISVQLLRRQYLQLLEPNRLAIPTPEIIRLPTVQRQIFESMFDEIKVPFLPPPRYQFRVLKILITAMEKAIIEPDEDVCLDHHCSSSLWRSSLEPSIFS